MALQRDNEEKNRFSSLLRDLRYFGGDGERKYEYMASKGTSVYYVIQICDPERPPPIAYVIL